MSISRAMIDTILKERKPVIAAAGDRVVDVALSASRLFTWERGLLQVLTNLIDNAIKYSAECRAADRPRRERRRVRTRFRLTVADNGIGFDMKYHDRIFGLFNRLVRQEDFEGTGAGLAIVRKVLEKMGGSIRAESAPGAGSTFIVDLPLRPPAPVPRTRRSARRQARHEPARPADPAGRRQSDGCRPHLPGVQGA